MQKKTPKNHQIEQVQQIYLSWEHYKWFYKKSQNPSFWEKTNPLFYLPKSVWQFQGPFCKDSSTLSELSFRHRTKNQEDEWGLKWYLWWGVYTSFATWTDWKNLEAATEAPSLKISSHGITSKWSQQTSQLARH